MQKMHFPAAKAFSICDQQGADIIDHLKGFYPALWLKRAPTADYNDPY